MRKLKNGRVNWPKISQVRDSVSESLNLASMWHCLFFRLILTTIKSLGISEELEMVLYSVLPRLPAPEST